MCVRPSCSRCLVPEPFHQMDPVGTRGAVSAPHHRQAVHGGKGSNRCIPLFLACQSPPLVSAYPYVYATAFAAGNASVSAGRASDKADPATGARGDYPDPQPPGLPGYLHARQCISVFQQRTPHQRQRSTAEGRNPQCRSVLLGDDEALALAEVVSRRQGASLRWQVPTTLAMAAAHAFTSSPPN